MSAGETIPRVRQKALDLNLDPLFYGSIAEIGAGQEVARHFFQAGGASGTIAKTLSAYDSNFSDAIYGHDESGRYVTRSRLENMLDKELDLVIERVTRTRPAGSTFFAFADTVAARAFKADRECHGWMGISFQDVPCAAPSRVVLHVRMLDETNQAQQEALGILGVNLIHAAYKHARDASGLLDALRDDLSWGRIEIDFVHFGGPCFSAVDDRIMNLRLVTSSLGPVATFGPDGRAAVPHDITHRSDVLILRGTFRPFLKVHSDMIRHGCETFAREIGKPTSDFTVLCEMNVARQLSEGIDESSDLVERIEAIAAAGHSSMITSHLRYFRLSEYFSRYARRTIGFILSVDNLYSIFDDRYYEGLEGGTLEAMGKLFSSNSKLLVYPNLREGRVVTASSIDLPETVRHLYQHLVHNRRILPLEPPPGILVPFEPDG